MHTNRLQCAGFACIVLLSCPCVVRAAAPSWCVYACVLVHHCCRVLRVVCVEGISLCSCVAAMPVACICAAGKITVGLALHQPSLQYRRCPHYMRHDLSHIHPATVSLYRCCSRIRSTFAWCCAGQGPQGACSPMGQSSCMLRADVDHLMQVTTCQAPALGSISHCPGAVQVVAT